MGAESSQSAWKIIAWKRTADYHLRHAISSHVESHLLIYPRPSRHSSPSHYFRISSFRDGNMSHRPILPKSVFFWHHVFLFFVFSLSQHNPSLGLCQSHFLPKSIIPPVSQSLSSVAAATTACSLWLHLFLLYPVSLSLSLCTSALSPSHPLRYVCLPLSSCSILTLLCSFLFISWHFSEVRRNSSFFLLTSVSAFVRLQLPRVSFFFSIPVFSISASGQWILKEDVKYFIHLLIFIRANVYLNVALQ